MSIHLHSKLHYNGREVAEIEVYGITVCVCHLKLELVGCVNEVTALQYDHYSKN